MFTHDDEDLGVEGSDRLLEGVAGVEIVEGGEAAGAVAPHPARGRGGGLGHENHWESWINRDISTCAFY